MGTDGSGQEDSEACMRSTEEPRIGMSSHS
jgi:hypothetical protein